MQGTYSILTCYFHTNDHERLVVANGHLERAMASENSDRVQRADLRGLLLVEMIGTELACLDFDRQVPHSACLNLFIPNLAVS